MGLFCERRRPLQARAGCSKISSFTLEVLEYHGDSGNVFQQGESGESCGLLYNFFIFQDGFQPRWKITEFSFNKSSEGPGGALSEILKVMEKSWEMLLYSLKCILSYLLKLVSSHWEAHWRSVTSLSCSIDNIYFNFSAVWWTFCTLKYSETFLTVITIQSLAFMLSGTPVIRFKTAKYNLFLWIEIHFKMPDSLFVGCNHLYVI